jgi:cobalt-zinc-cadmium efflux system membrane fusion protein
MAALAVFGLLAGCRAPAKPKPIPEPQATPDAVLMSPDSPQLTALNIEPAASQAPADVPLPGRLTWDEEATVRVFTPFAGRVQSIPARINQQISKGAPLAEILSPDFGQAVADAHKAEADFRRAERSLNRLRDLSEHGAAPRKELESAEADLENARAEKERAQARLFIYGSTETNGGNTFILPSPLDGMVVEKNVTPGQEVRADQMLANMPQFTAPLFVVTDPSRLWIQVDATEADLAHLQPGRQFTFSSRAFPGETFTGKVETVSAFLDPATHTIKVRGSVDNSRRLLKAEMFVNVSIPDHDAPSATVPSKAVFLSGDKHYVFLERQPGDFARREVRIGPEHDGHIPILAGVQPGQRVVTEGCLLLQQLLK